MTSKVSLKSAKALGTNSNSSSENGSIQDKPEAESEKPDSQNSGYSADGSAAANLPVFIDLMEGNKHNLDNPCSPGQGHSIRRKIAELSFAASNAFADMEKGKLPFPKIEVNDFRKLAGWNVDMTKVKLKSANVVGDNPFLVETKIDEEILQGCAEYQKLFLATYETYEKVEGEEWGDSSTSSVTSSESDDGVNSNPDASSLVIHPRLEDALRAKSLKATEDAKPKRSSSKRKRCADLRAKIIHPLEKLPHITMNDALDASDEARLVTLAFSPYIVVHVNVAYTRLTGFSSAKALGRPLYECLGSQCKEWMDACTATYPVAALQDRSSGIFCTKGNKRNHCRFRTCLVGPPLEGKKKGVDTSVTTHFAISMIPVEPPKEAQAAVRLQKEAPPAITAVAFVHDFSHKQVMG